MPADGPGQVRSAFSFLLTSLVAAMIAITAGASGAVAQEKRSPSILEFFGLKPARPKVTVKKVAPKVKKAAARPSQGRKVPKPGGTAKSAPKQAPSVEPPALADKLTDAKRIIVIGDFMAGGVAEGLQAAFAADAGIMILDQSNGSSGFVRDDVVNWSERIAPLVAETGPALVIVMIGTNDRQQMMVAGNREPVQSPAWAAEYESRVSAFTAALKSAGIPVVWIGLPPFKQKTMSAGILAFNDLYERKVIEIGGRFVDIWDGFLDEQGAFTINGFDYTGQPAKLRSSDGINLTSAGKRKIAFFAERSIRELLGSVPQTAVLAPTGPFALPGPVRPASAKPQNIVSLPPISLFDPAFDGAGDLLGAGGAPVAAPADLPATELYVYGKMPAPKPGRVDDYRIKLPSSDAAATQTP